MIYNVRVSIVELVEATSEEEAVRKLIAKVESKDLNAMDDECAVICPHCGNVAEERKYHDAFESDELDPKTLAAVLR